MQGSGSAQSWQSLLCDGLLVAALPHDSHHLHMRAVFNLEKIDPYGTQQIAAVRKHSLLCDGLWLLLHQMIPIACTYGQCSAIKMDLLVKSHRQYRCVMPRVQHHRNPKADDVHS